jgi:hypothetical protein
MSMQAEFRTSLAALPSLEAKRAAIDAALESGAISRNSMVFCVTSDMFTYLAERGIISPGMLVNYICSFINKDALMDVFAMVGPDDVVDVENCTYDFIVDRCLVAKMIANPHVCEDFVRYAKQYCQRMQMADFARISSKLETCPSWNVRACVQAVHVDRERHALTVDAFMHCFEEVSGRSPGPVQALLSELLPMHQGRCYDVLEASLNEWLWHPVDVSPDLLGCIMSVVSVFILPFYVTDLATLRESLIDRMIRTNDQKYTQLWDMVAAMAKFGTGQPLPRYPGLVPPVSRSLANAMMPFVKFASVDVDMVPYGRLVQMVGPQDGRTQELFYVLNLISGFN